MESAQLTVPQVVTELCDTLRAGGFDAYLVGGCVRDLLLLREPKDWDITTNAKPEQIQALFEETFYENAFGTVGVVTTSDDPRLKVVEVTPYRIEGKYSNARHPDEVRFSDTLEDDLKRRPLEIGAECSCGDTVYCVAYASSDRAEGLHPVRAQCCYLSDAEIEKVCQFWKNQGKGHCPDREPALQRCRPADDGFSD